MSTMSQLGEFLATIQNKQDARTAELEARLAELESKEECGCGSYDELLASYEERISALEGNAGGGSTEGEGGSTEGEGGSTEGGEEGGSTEPMTASQALAKYNHIMFTLETGSNYFAFMSMYDHKYSTGSICNVTQPGEPYTVASILFAKEGDIVKVYTPDLQEIEIIVDLTLPYRMALGGEFNIAFANTETKKVYCYQYNGSNRTVSACTNAKFIALWGDKEAFGL